MKALLRGWELPKTRPLTLPASFESDYMNERPRMAAECQLVDDGSGERTLWRVEQKEGMVQVQDDMGIYYAEACYVMLYKYGQGRRCRNIVRRHLYRFLNSLIFKKIIIQLLIFIIKLVINFFVKHVVYKFSSKLYL